MKMTPLSFDIETMGFKAKILPMLSCSFQWGDDEAGQFNLDKMSTPDSDELLALEIRDVLESAPLLLGWNSNRFDLHYINTRLSFHGHRPVVALASISVDVVYDKMLGRRTRTSLINAANEMGVTDEKIHKTPIDWEKWHAANEGDQAGMDYVVEHGAMDTILTKRIYNGII